ncbi:MAG: serine protease [Pseudomonadota bacterium]
MHKVWALSVAACLSLFITGHASPVQSQVTPPSGVSAGGRVFAQAEIDETPRQARASEALLSRAEREELQVALRWAGFYRAAIDGAFGRGTRGAMSAWQSSAGYQPTGVLTTQQRAVLLEAYNAVLAGVVMEFVEIPEAGLTLKMPVSEVMFDRYEPPLGYYTARTNTEAGVTLISLTGDRAALSALYRLILGAELMPVEGERSLSATSFEIDGQDDARTAYAYVELSRSAIRGFILEWPAGDEPRRARILEEMRASLVHGRDVLPNDLGGGTRLGDHLAASNLKARRPARVLSGFYADGAGTIATSRSAIASCDRITIGLDGSFGPEMRMLAGDSPVALLRPEQGDDTSLVMPSYQTGSIPTGAPVFAAGYSFEGALGNASLTPGRVVALEAAAPESGLLQIDLAALPGDIGGPILDQSGAVVGVLTPVGDFTDRILPENVRLIAPAALTLAQTGLSADTQEGAGPVLEPTSLLSLARDLVVPVNCW